MTDGDKIARLRLIRSERIGPVTYFQLLNRFGSAEAALSALPDLARRGGGKAPRIATKADAEREMAAVEKAGAKQLFLGLPDRKSTRMNSSHYCAHRMPSSA